MNKLDKVSKLRELVEQLGQSIDNMIDRIYDEVNETPTICADHLGVNNAIDCIHDFCKARKGRCIGCPAYLTFRVESGETVQTCKFRCDAPANWEHLEIGGADDD